MTRLTSDNTLLRGDRVVIEEGRDKVLATVITLPLPTGDGTADQTLQKVLHRASPEELDRFALEREKAMEMLGVAQHKARERNLAIKIAEAELIEEGRKVLFIFSAEERVDFRGLVKDLANALRLRVEMRQVGARDETKYIGVLGACGQVTTCCSTFLRHFQPISIGMAKTQGLPPNPVKHTGMCGKLKCCLAYENTQYAEARKNLAKVGAAVKSPQGFGKIISIDVLRRRYAIVLDEGGMVHLESDQCTPLDAKDKTARERALEMIQETERRREEKHRARQEKREKRASSHERQK